MEIGVTGVTWLDLILYRSFSSIFKCYKAINVGRLFMEIVVTGVALSDLILYRLSFKTITAPNNLSHVLNS